MVSQSWRAQFEQLVHDEHRSVGRTSAFLRAVCAQIVAHSPAVPSSLFAEVVYAFESKQVPLALRKAAYAILHSNDVEIPHSTYTLLRICAMLLEVDCSWEAALSSTEKTVATVVPPTLPSAVESIECVVAEILNKGRKPTGQRWVALRVVHSKYGECTVEFRDPWIQTALKVRLGTTIRLLHARKVSPGTLRIEGLQSACVLEPDYLVDATDIAHCLAGNGHNALLYLLKQYLPRTTSQPMIKGIAAGTVLETFLQHPQLPVHSAVDKAIQGVRHLVQLTAANPENSLESLRVELEKHARVMLRSLQHTRGKHTFAEMSLASPRFGLSGRLDVVAFSETDIVVTELKSGKPPRSIPFPGHSAQVMVYGLLIRRLQYAKDRSVALQMLYSGAREQEAIKPIAFDPSLANYVVQIRNDIVAQEIRITNRVFRDIVSGQLMDQDLPPFMATQVREFSSLIHVLLDPDTPEVVALYIKLVIAFIARENWCQRLSPGRPEEQAGYSSLWRSSLDEKQDLNSAVGWLTRDKHAKQRVLFTKRSTTTSVFRDGDVVVVHPHSEQGEFEVDKQPLLRCRIERVTQDGFELSKAVEFTAAPYVAVEKDFIASSFKALYTSVFLFATAPSVRQQYYVGLLQPEARERPEFTAEYLSSEQQSTIHKLACAKNYFVLQGPPGTGKTSRIMRGFCERQVTMTDETTLVCAYTNRAVQEICAALDASSLPYTRIEPVHANSKNSVYTLSTAGEHQLAEVLKERRIIVGTIASLLSQEEVWRHVQPKTLVVDEASQITEAHLCGLIARVQKFILIGDHNQLPPVVMQQQAGTTIPLTQMRTLEFDSLHNSPFQRLHRLATERGWQHAVGMLTQQGRMHESICSMASHMFYSGALHTFASQELTCENRSTTESHVENAMFHKRVTFIDVAHSEHNAREIRCVLATVRAAFRFKEIEGTADIGIVAPFRKHVAGIRRALQRAEAPPNISVDTIERYQGSEREVIVFSTGVTSGNVSKLGSIDSLTQVDRRLNVAITRARQKLVIIGTSALLEELPAYKQMLDWIRKHGSYISAQHLPDLNKEFSSDSPFL